jgi:hypothetical protein
MRVALIGAIGAVLLGPGAAGALGQEITIRSSAGGATACGRRSLRVRNGRVGGVKI